jgi:hypothetical protein
LHQQLLKFEEPPLDLIIFFPNMDKSTITVKDEGVFREVELDSEVNSLAGLTGSMEDRKDMYRMGKPQELKVRFCRTHSKQQY